MLIVDEELFDDLAYRVVAKSACSDGYRDMGTDSRDEVYASLKFLINDDQNIMLSAAYTKDAIPVDSIGHPIHIYNAGSVNGKTAGEAGWQDLINDQSDRKDSESISKDFGIGAKGFGQK